MDGYYYRPRIDADYLAAHSEGLICTSGCLAAELPTLLKNGQEDKALERLQWYRDVFGPDRWYVEFQEHDIPELTQVNKQLFAFARQYDMPDGRDQRRALRRARRMPTRTTCCSACRPSSLVTEADRMRMTANSYFLKSLDQMRQTFLPWPTCPTAPSPTRSRSPRCATSTRRTSNTTCRISPSPTASTTRPTCAT